MLRRIRKMDCPKCKEHLTRLKRRYFSKKIRCPYCGFVVDDDYPLDWDTIKMDFLLLIGYVKHGR
jgi:hypothetical protein